jgi:geranylgeranylglycerol-phosphate geranylgeranyltransferase
VQDPNNPQLSPAARFGAYLSIVRIPNCIMIGLAVVIGEAIALGGLPPVTASLSGFLTASLMMAGTMTLNDIYDLPGDRVNNPSRPLVSGRIGLSEARILSAVTSALSIVFAIILGILTTLVALLALYLMVYYNTRGKRTGLLGNIVVSFNVALPFFYGGVAVNILRPLLFVFAALAFLANIGREVAKGIPDEAGDKETGVRTITVLRGPKAAAKVSAALFISAVLLSFTPLLFGSVSPFYFPGVVLADIGFIYSAVRLVRSQNPLVVKKVKTQVLLWMLFGLIGFLLGGLSSL